MAEHQEETDYVVARLPRELFQELIASNRGVEEFPLGLDRIKCPDGTVRRIKGVEFGDLVESGMHTALAPSSSAGCYMTFRYENGTLVSDCVGQCPQANYRCQKVATPGGGETCQCVRVE